MNTPSTQERRRVKRRSLAYYMLVLDDNTNATIGHLVDITPQGLMMDTPKPLPLQQDFRLRLDLTPDVSDRDHIAFTARTKWCAPDVIEPYLYDVGFSIITISTYDARVLEHIAEIYAAHEGYTFPPS